MWSLSFMLPMIGDLKFSKLDFDYTCAYTRKEYAPNTESRKFEKRRSPKH